MDPFLLLLIGLATVLGGILWLRLHPFIALFIAALLISSITPKSQIIDALTDKYKNEQIKKELETLKKLQDNERQTRVDSITEKSKQHAKSYANSKTPIMRITTEFGITFAKIGLVIALACLIGRCLLASGAANRIVRSALSVVGEKGAPAAFLGSGFALGIPVFFDSLFLLAVPLAKAMWLKLRKNYLLLIVAIIAGGSMTHSLVPPTPGPLYVASVLGINIGTMILAGLVVGLFTASAGYLYGVWLNRRMDIPFRETPEAIEKLESLIRQGNPRTAIPLCLVAADCVARVAHCRWHVDCPDGGLGRIEGFFQITGRQKYRARHCGRSCVVHACPSSQKQKGSRRTNAGRAAGGGIDYFNLLCRRRVWGHLAADRYRAASAIQGERRSQQFMAAAVGVFGDHRHPRGAGLGHGCNDHCRRHCGQLCGGQS